MRVAVEKLEYNQKVMITSAAQTRQYPLEGAFEAPAQVVYVDDEHPRCVIVGLVVGDESVAIEFSHGQEVEVVSPPS